MSELENTRRHIQRGGKILSKICGVARSVLLALLIVQIVLALLAAFVPQAQEAIGPHMAEIFFFDTLGSIEGVEALPIRYQALIGCAVILLVYSAFFIVLRLFGGMMKRLSEAERPFDVEAAKKMRRKSFWLLLFLVYNPVLAVVSFALMLLFSYIMEYGGYIQERADETNRIQEEIILSFAELTENKSGQTGQHIKRVSEYSRIIASQLGLTPEQIESIRIASTMHDVGKLLIPSEVLEKPGRLTDEEYATIKTHTTMGGQLLKNVEGEEMQLSRTIAMQHHERPDGSGYPESLRSEDISLEGKIVAVADVYDALTSRRSYKDAWKEEDAYREILKGKGTQFDPAVVDAFAAAHEKILAVQSRYRD